MRMRAMKKPQLSALVAICGMLLMAGTGFAYEINDKFSIGGVVAGIWQYMDLSNSPFYDNSEETTYESQGRGLLAFQLGLWNSLLLGL